MNSQRNYDDRGPHHSQNNPSSQVKPRLSSYANEQGHLRPEVVDSEARSEADLWVQSKISYSQIRKFFGAVRGDERRFALTDPSDAEAQVAMMMLKTKAHYAAAREGKHKPIADFFTHHAQLVKTPSDFGFFLRHFEAAVAYHKFLEKDQKNVG